MTLNDTARAWLSRATGFAPAQLRLQTLAGATSSTVSMVTAAGGSERFVLRVLDNAAWLAEEPDVAEHEAAALTQAQRARLPAPRLVAIAGPEAGFGAPVVLMSFLAGCVQLRPENFDSWLAALATQLATIHAHPAESLRWSFDSWVDAEALAPPAWSTKPAMWQTAIDRWRSGPPTEPVVFVHRDYHPVNVLWQDGAVSGVVDWVSACRGPAGVVVAHCRTDLTLMYGPALAAGFLAAYRAAVPGYRYDPYWDIDSILDMCLPEPSYYPPWREFGLAHVGMPELRRRLETHLEAVVQRLEGRIRKPGMECPRRRDG